MYAIVHRWTALRRYGAYAMTLNQHPVLYCVDFSRCTVLSSLSSEGTTETFIDALERAGATIVKTASHNFPGKGLTCVLILAESHAILHTWPETGTVNIDIFSCSPRLQSLAAIVELGKAFGADGMSVQEIIRSDGRASAPDERWR